MRPLLAALLVVGGALTAQAQGTLNFLMGGAGSPQPFNPTMALSLQNAANALQPYLSSASGGTGVTNLDGTIIAGTNVVSGSTTAQVVSVSVPGLAANGVLTVTRPMQIIIRSDVVEDPVQDNNWQAGAVTNASVRDEAYVASGYGATNLQLHIANYWQEPPSFTLNYTTLTNIANSVTNEWSIEYPSNVFTRVTWNGSNTTNLPPGGTAISDPVHIGIPAGSPFWIRGFLTPSVVQAFNLPVGFAANQYRGGHPPNGGFCYFNTNDWVLGGGAATNNSFYYSVCPVAVVGQAVGARSIPLVVGIVGDSIAQASPSGPLFTGFDYNRSFITEALADSGIPFIQTASGGGLIAGIFNNPAVAQPFYSWLCSNVNVVVSQAGINDLCSLHSFDTVTNDYFTLWSTLASNGVRVYQTTLAPVGTACTNSCVTNGLLMAVNQWIRTTPPPLSGYIDSGNAVASAYDSGLWGALNGQGLTVEGIHPNALGSALMLGAFSQGAPFLGRSNVYSAVRISEGATVTGGLTADTIGAGTVALGSLSGTNATIISATISNLLSGANGIIAIGNEDGNGMVLNSVNFVTPVITQMQYAVASGFPSMSNAFNQSYKLRTSTATLTAAGVSGLWQGTTSNQYYLLHIGANGWGLQKPTFAATTTNCAYFSTVGLAGPWQEGHSQTNTSGSCVASNPPPLAITGNLPVTGTISAGAGFTDASGSNITSWSQVHGASVTTNITVSPDSNGLVTNYFGGIFTNTSLTDAHFDPTNSTIGGRSVSAHLESLATNMAIFEVWTNSPTGNLGILNVSTVTGPCTGTGY